MSTSASAEERLNELNIELPPTPKPLGAYVEAVQTGNLLFVSGMLLIVGPTPQFVGRVGQEISEVSPLLA